MKMQRMTQRQRVLKYMEDFGSITLKDAFVDLGVGRLAARIEELRKSGYPIVSVFEKGQDRYGNAVYYARYSIKA